MTIYSRHDEARAYNGMSMRDYLAAQALAGLCANPGGPFQASDLSGWTMVNCGPEHVARQCYQMADAMLEERDAPTTKTDQGAGR